MSEIKACNKIKETHIAKGKNDRMRISDWKKYEYEKSDRLPSGMSVEICKLNVSSKTTSSFDLNQIITTYKKYYFLENATDDHTDDQCPKGIIQSSKWAETQVIGLIGSKEWDEQSVKQILAWKTGKIDHKTTQEKKCFNYYKGWQEKSAVQLPNQQPMNTTVFEELSVKVVKLHKRYNERKIEKDKVWAELLKYVNENNIVGLGTVYLITLLFFITNGECPIYDRFAMAALASFVLGKDKGIIVPDGAIIRGCGLPDRKSKDANQLLSDPDSKYVKYQQLLEDFFVKFFPIFCT